ncbi:hypothetical protein LG047_08250 [Methylocystis sp. WRRC1]|uniref:hypothetical protein n=1 Tax=Methylocystis sp. WRRC1 TaxID=1732014 RepID=UPI001D14C741|nr:hypothetical protein [Methylocystis sp. WRRC1]MCC3245313.1 hypothetical protein [Methylocystis sp. WRRC1]
MDDIVRWLVGDPFRRGQSFLNGLEQRFLQEIVRDLPHWVTPSHLSLFGASAAAIVAGALFGANSYPWLIWLIPAAMTMNWLGLSLDLPLARLNGAELPRAGMAHHLAELFSHLLIILAYGFSPYLTFRSATIILVCYLLFSSYTYIRAATRHVEQMAYIGIGVTEFRVLLALWPFIAVALGVPESLDDRLPAIDVAIMALGFFTVIGLVAKLFLDGRKIAAASGRED